MLVDSLNFQNSQATDSLLFNSKHPTKNALREQTKKYTENQATLKNTTHETKQRQITTKFLFTSTE